MGCKKSRDCFELGKCTPKTRKCEASAEDCRNQRACKAHGQCHVGKYGGCKTSDESCRKSEACRRLGLCKASWFSCVPVGDSCKRNERCKTEGLCAKVGGMCKATECKNTPACKKQGRCKLKLPHGMCLDAAGRGGWPDVCEKMRLCANALPAWKHAAMPLAVDWSQNADEALLLSHCRGILDHIRRTAFKGTTLPAVCR
jgi:hypothetical protein